MDFRLQNCRTNAILQLGIVFVLLIAHNAIAAPESDLVERLPGQTQSVSFKQYAGYINLNADKALFYYFVEADNASPKSTPLALWLTGGPGCSSLGYGAFEEHGPFRPKGDILLEDMHSWNRETNMLYVESPIGVGFSYSNNSNDYVNFNDSSAAQDNLAFLLNWYEKFPEYRNLDFYITGESYGGHYVPQLATLVIDYNKNNNMKPINLKGISLGNPFLDIEISIENGGYLWSHGLISDRTYKFTRKVCNTSTEWLESFVTGNLSDACAQVSSMVADESGNVNVYDVILDDCVTNSETQISALQGKVTKPKPSKFHKKIAQNHVDVCIEDEITTYINRADVQKALHANTTENIPGPWNLCYGPLVYDSRDRGINIIPVLSDILKAGIPMILYGGDQDSLVPFSGTRRIANKLAKQLHLYTVKPYGPWYDQQQIGGWSEAFGHRKKGMNQTMLTFATVRGAAHEVPYTNPSQGLTLFRSFIRGLPLRPPPM